MNTQKIDEPGAKMQQKTILEEPRNSDEKTGIELIAGRCLKSPEWGKYKVELIVNENDRVAASEEIEIGGAKK